MVRISSKNIKHLKDPHRDWSAFDNLTENDIRKAVADDPEAVPLDMDWSDAIMLNLKPKVAISLRLDSDIHDFFKSTGKGYQTRMNAVLRAFMMHQRKK